MHLERYPEALVMARDEMAARVGEIETWLRGLDVLLTAETPYWFGIYELARSCGVRTVNQVNPEFYVHEVDPSLPRPDLCVAPTVWRLGSMPGVVHLPFPVDRVEFPFRLRERAQRFVHVAGHPAMVDRAGTATVLGAIGRVHVRPPPTFGIRAQSPLGMSAYHARHIRPQIGDVEDPAELYADADVVLLPRRYGGQSLTVNEALSSGCPVVMLDREPEKTWGGVHTIHCRPRRRVKMQPGAIEIYDGSSMALARAIDELASTPEKVKALSEQADTYAESIGWDALLPQWMDTLSCVADGQLPAVVG